MDSFDPNKFRLPEGLTGDTSCKTVSEKKVTRRQQSRKFLKGPVPLPWLLAAAKLPGKALAVGIAVWFRSGLERSATVSLPTTLLSLFGVSRHTKARALDALEGAALIAVDRRSGKNPVVTLLEVPEEL